MKEKIIEMLIDHQPKDVMNDGGIAGFVQYTEYGLIAYEIEQFINQEVEKRIAEKMPSEEEIGNSVLDYCANPTEDGGVDFDQKQGYSFQCGIEWLLSCLTCSEKPNNSQKTEGGNQ